MLEIIILYFLCKHIGQLSLSKGLKPLPWKIYTILAWIAAEFLGVIIGAILFGIDIQLALTEQKEKLSGLMLFSLVCAFGGYLIVRRILEKRNPLPPQ